MRCVVSLFRVFLCLNINSSSIANLLFADAACAIFRMGKDYGMIAKFRLSTFGDVFLRYNRIRETFP